MRGSELAAAVGARVGPSRDGGGGGGGCGAAPVGSQTARSGWPSGGWRRRWQARRGHGASGAGRMRDFGDKKAVWKLVDGKPQMVIIKPGLTDGSTTEMLEGDLQPGDELITEVTGVKATQHAEDRSLLMSPPLVEMRGIERTYVMGDNLVHALRGVDLTIEQGVVDRDHGHVGLRQVDDDEHHGLPRSADEGQLPPQRQGRREAVASAQLADVRGRMIGFVFQSFNLLSRTTALENVEMPLMYQGVGSRDRHKRAMAALERVGLEGREDHTPNQLSGGQQQRVAIARALVTDAPVIMADEPTGNLDTKTSYEVMAILQGLVAEGTHGDPRDPRDRHRRVRVARRHAARRL